MNKIKKALISVSDKSNLKDLLKILTKYKVEFISSGGTYKEIRKLKFECLEVSEYTGSHEILGGRVKTLHPKIHAGILSKRENKKHKNDLKNNKINIDNGLYFGKKDSFVDNKNIVISGMTNDENQTIKWEITKL